MKVSVKQRLINLFIALDQLFWVVITLGAGYPDETISAAAYRYEKQGKLWAYLLRPFIDFIFFFDKNHCRESYKSEREGRHLPIDYR